MLRNSACLNNESKKLISKKIFFSPAQSNLCNEKKPQKSSLSSVNGTPCSWILLLWSTLEYKADMHMDVDFCWVKLLLFVLQTKELQVA